MRHIRRLLLVLGFSVQYLVPIVLFGGVIPYTHGELAAGLTKAGYFAGAVIALVLFGKAKDWLHAQPKRLLRALCLSIYPVAAWAILMVGLNWIATFVTCMCAYWSRVILFIIIGRLFYCIEELLAAEAAKKETV